MIRPEYRHFVPKSPSVKTPCCCTNTCLAVITFFATTLLSLGPISAATLLVDFDANQNVTTGAGSSVTAWADLVTGAGNNDATPFNAGSAPILETGIFAGGQPGVKFDGIDDVLSFSDAGFPTGTSSYTLVAAWKATTFANSSDPNSFSRPTIGGYGSQAINARDAAILAIRPDGNKDPNSGTAVIRSNGNDENFGDVPPVVEKGALPVESNTNYVQIISRTSETDHEATLLTPTETFTASGSGWDAGAESLKLGSGTIGNMLAVPAAGDFAESRFTGYVGRLQIWDGALSGGELQTVINEMNVYVSGGAPPAAPTAFAWNTDSSGAWTQNSNWTNSSHAPPNNPNHTATFGDAIAADRMIYTEEAVTVNRIEFDNASASYFIAGTRGINLAATTADPSENPSISVAGSHEFQAAVSIHNDTTIDIASASTLTFNNALNLNGHAITKTGSGELSLNNLLNSGGGSLDVLEGTVSGNGALGGNVVNNGGTISPGNSSQASGVPEPTCFGLLLLGLLCMGTAIGRRPS